MPIILKYILTLIFVASCSHGFGQLKDTLLIFDEDFDDNFNGWDIQSNDDVEQYIDSGYYAFENKLDKGFALTSVGLSVKDSLNFRIVTSILQQKGRDDLGFGIFVRDSYLNEINFLISGDGHFQAFSWNSTKTTKIRNWEKSPFVQTGNTNENILTISKIDRTLYFFINGTCILSSPYLLSKIEAIGYITDTGIGINSTKLKVEYLPEDTPAPTVYRSVYANDGNRRTNKQNKSIYKYIYPYSSFCIEGCFTVSAILLLLWLVE